MKSNLFLYGWLVVMLALLGTCQKDDPQPAGPDLPPAIRQSTFQAEAHYFEAGGEDRRYVTRDFTFPSLIDDYARVEVSIQLDCPNGNCDPVERMGSLSILVGNDTVEMARYATPQGINCSYTVDITDYRALLKDQVILSSFIDVTTNPGWLLTADFSFIPGITDHETVEVDQIWSDQHVVFGNPQKPADAPTLSKTWPKPPVRALVRILATGHGRGNSQNAAEYLETTNRLVINQTQSLDHLVWRVDCKTNPCGPQASDNWKNARAGWCPGASVEAAIFEIPSSILSSGTASFQYLLQDYVNDCRPDNSNCTVTTECPDCAFDGDGHTEPFFRVSVQLISFYN